MKTQQLKLKDNVVWLQMVSMRDKATGAFSVMMDGNVNNTLHTLASSIDDVKSFTWYMPELTESDRATIEAYNENYFQKKIYVIEKPENFGANAGEHRKLWAEQQLSSTSQKLSIYGAKVVDVFVSDYPISPLNFEIDPEVELHYNLSLTKTALDDNGPGTDYFEIESKLASFDNVTSVNLFSNNQYVFFESQIEDMTKIFRRSGVFSKSFLEFVAAYVVENVKHHETENAIQEFKETVELHSDRKLLLYPHRLDDPRYKLDEFLKSEVSDEKYFAILMTNPTNISTSAIIEKLNIGPDFTTSISIICQDDDIDKRLLYMFLISKLKDQVEVWHFEKDFHTGTAEQFIMLGPDGCIFKNDALNADIVSSYITE